MTATCFKAPPLKWMGLTVIPSEGFGVLPHMDGSCLRVTSFMSQRAVHVRPRDIEKYVTSRRARGQQRQREISASRLWCIGELEPLPELFYSRFVDYDADEDQ